MALIAKLTMQTIHRDAAHLLVDCTYSIVNTPEGAQLQIDTYGSSKRQIRGKKSQSLRFSREALMQLRGIVDVVIGQ
jgi:hypothetical protein